MQKAARFAREGRARTVPNIDYRPHLWSVAGHGEGESRRAPSDEATKRLRAVLPLFDFVAGTEGNVTLRAARPNTIAALRALRALRKRGGGALARKQGAMGASTFPDAIPDSLNAGITGRRFDIAVSTYPALETAPWPACRAAGFVIGTGGKASPGRTSATRSLQAAMAERSPARAGRIAVSSEAAWDAQGE